MPLEGGHKDSPYLVSFLWMAPDFQNLTSMTGEKWLFTKSSGSWAWHLIPLWGIKKWKIAKLLEKREKKKDKIGCIQSGMAIY